MHQQDDDTANGGTLVWTTASSPNGAINASYGAGTTAARLSTTFVEKKSVAYVIIIDDNATLLLKEQPVITPREMINIAKFINMVNNYLVAAVSRINLVVNWQALIQSLKIEKHFVAMPGADAYDLDSDTLFVFVTSR